MEEHENGAIKWQRWMIRRGDWDGRPVTWKDVGRPMSIFRGTKYDKTVDQAELARVQKLFNR